MVHDNRCINCGVDIEKDYILFINGTEYVFDSFECAINFAAPRCANCNSIIMGRGFHADGEIYCTPTCSHLENHTPVVP